MYIPTVSVYHYKRRIFDCVCIQWDVLSEYARTSNLTALHLQCCWRMPGWDMLSDIMNIYGVPELPDMEEVCAVRLSPSVLYCMVIVFLK